MRQCWWSRHSDDDTILSWDGDGHWTAHDAKTGEQIDDQLTAREIETCAQIVYEHRADP